MTPQREETITPTRREFLLGLAAAAALPVVQPASAQTTSAATPAVAGQPAAVDPAKVDAVMALLTLRFGSYIGHDEMALVRRSLERQEAAISTLQQIPIHNWDAPDFLFIPDAV